ncbi:MAG: N-formylglutamate amidohydrolase [Alphaproteobacteria bacterium]|nr:MAG: N-formylglutamate amidohydrolase [Alphaproteobacteria bacterium]
MTDSPSQSAGPDHPFRIIGPDAPASPVLLSVPHAGRDYSDALLKAARLPRAMLESLEDRLVDRLVWRAAAAGSTAIVATVPRAEIDLNRDEREIDPATILPSPAAADILQSARTRGGLGLVPSRIAGAGALWRHRLPASELRRRIAEVHRPYHAEVDARMQAIRARFGIAILLDCHSMPPRDGGRVEPRIVIGDRHGTSSGGEYTAAAEAAARAAGFETARNAPYAGGYVTERHGRPNEGLHALQLEIDRSLYLAAGLRAPGPGFERIAELIENVVAALGRQALEPPMPIAAE